MGLLTQTQQQYYAGAKSFTGDGTTTIFTVSNTFSAFPSWFNASNVIIHIDNDLFAQATTPQIGSSATSTVNYTFSWDTSIPNGWHIEFATAPTDGAVIVVNVSTDFGNYQYITIKDIINNFIVAYIGEGKIITKVKRTDVAFHAQRALQELSYDTLRSLKTQEIEVPASLKMILPQDYVGYVKLTWVDSAGIEHILYPARKTSNPTAIKQDSDGNYVFDIDDDGTEDTTLLINPNDSDTWTNYKSATPSENQDKYDDETYWPNEGRRYGLDPQHAQINGSYFIDNLRGYIYFSSNMSGKTVTLKYIGDGLGQTVGCTTYNPNDIGDTASGEVSPQPYSSLLLNPESWASILCRKYNSWKEQGMSMHVADLIKWVINGNPGMGIPAHPNFSTIEAEAYLESLCNPSTNGRTSSSEKLSTVCSVEDAVVHKFAEEAMYKWILCAVMSTRANVPEYAIQRYKKDKFATTRTAKLRLSNIKMEELTQVLRGKSKQIKH